MKAVDKLKNSGTGEAQTTWSLEKQGKADFIGIAQNKKKRPSIAP